MLGFGGRGAAGRGGLDYLKAETAGGGGAGTAQQMIGSAESDDDYDSGGSEDGDDRSRFLSADYDYQHQQDAQAGAISKVFHYLGSWVTFGPPSQ